MSRETLDDLLNKVDYSLLEKNYVPSEFALNYINFIKLVNGGKGEENKSPLVHLDLLDAIGQKGDILCMAHRGFAKTSICAEYLILYIGLMGKLPNHGTVDMGIYIGDTMENGVKSLRKNLEYRYNSSEFLQKYIPDVKFIENEWQFTNLEKQVTTFKGVGVGSSIRGTKDHGKRPTLIIIDDVLTDKNASSETIIQDITKTIYDGARNAMHPTKRKMIWIGTPFNKKDPLYQTAGLNSWITKVYPICEKFPCTREEFKGSWEDRFNYDFVKKEYNLMKEAGKIDAFNKELMLRIMSDEDRLVLDSDIKWYNNRSDILDNKSRYNWYITTDLATSEKDKADYSVISVWCIDGKGVWYYVDGIVERQNINKSIDNIFNFVEIYNPFSVAIESTGQQQGFIQVIKKEMQNRDKWFRLASDNKTGESGIRSSGSKLVRFNNVVPLFKQNKIKFPIEFNKDKRINEALDELKSVTLGGFKSRHDDFCDTISQLALINAIKPYDDSELIEKGEVIGRNVFRDVDVDTSSKYSSYII